MAAQPPPPPLPEQRAETLHTIRQFRSALGSALSLELREGQASAEGSDDWEEINDAKWAAYTAAAEMIPGGVGMLDLFGEDAFLRLISEYNDMTSYQMAKALKLPW